LSRIAPVEGEWRFAEGEAIDVTGDGALEGFELILGTGLEPAFQRVGMRRQHWSRNLEIEFTPDKGKVVFPRNARGANWPGDATLRPPSWRAAGSISVGPLD
jgi:hypothetical protein